jgi:hypothetical protein
MSKSTDHESRAFAVLQSANPARVEDIRRELDEESLAAALAHARAVLDCNHQIDVGRRADRAAGRAPRNARRVRIVGAAAVAMALALTGLLAVLPGGGAPAPARAQRVLYAAASIAAAQPATAPGPGEYTYVKQRRGLIGGPSETVVVDRHGWLRADAPERPTLDRGQ